MKLDIILRNLEKKLRKIYGNEEEIVKNSVSSLLLPNQKIYIEVIPHQDWSLYDLVSRGSKSKLWKYIQEAYSNSAEGYRTGILLPKTSNQPLVVSREVTPRDLSGSMILVGGGNWRFLVSISSLTDFLYMLKEDFIG